MQAARHFVAQCFRIVVIVLTNIGVGSSILACTLVLLGCSPGTVRVVRSDSTAFHEILLAEVSADARRSAHLMGQTVRGGSSGKVGVLKDDRLPKAYTPDEQDGGSSSQFHLAYAARRLIREHYAASQPTYRPLEEGDIVEIVDEAGGNLGFINDWDKDRHPDIANIEGRVLFEMVPPGPTHQQAGSRKVDWHLRVINAAMLGVPEFKLGTGYAGEVGVRFAEGAAPWMLTWATMAPRPSISMVANSMVASASATCHYDTCARESA